MLPALLGRDSYLRCIRTNIRPPPPLAPAFRECTDRSSCKPALESEHSRPATLAARFYGCSKSGCEFVRAARRALANGLPPSRAGVLVCRRVAARRATNAATRRPAGVRAVSAIVTVGACLHIRWTRRPALWHAPLVVTRTAAQAYEALRFQCPRADCWLPARFTVGLEPMGLAARRIRRGWVGRLGERQDRHCG
jgi:hypothetical protein